MEEWWNECHETPGSLYISNYGGRSLWKAMNIRRRVRWRRKVLEIGVGDGKNIRSLRRRGCKVYALDITPAAFEKVKGLTTETWLAPENLPDNFFDLAISHLVTQHIDNGTLELQVRNVLRSLRTGGLLAMQFADWMGIATDYDESFQFQQSGTVRRTLEMIRHIISACEGRIVWVSDPIDFPEFHSRWFYVHIQRLTLTDT
jgi:SAM-dependent methyltransferase